MTSFTPAAHDGGVSPPVRHPVIRGGRAHLRGMTLFNRQYAVKATRKRNGDITFAWMTYSNYRRRMQLAIFGLGLIFLVALLCLPGEEVPFMPQVPYLTGLLDRLSVLLLLVALPYAVCRYTPLGGYHAAEHQVISANLRGDLTLESTQQADRTSPYCGTVYIAVVIATLLPLAILPVDSLYYLVVAAGLLLLVLLLDRSPKFRQHTLVLKLGLTYQRHITTRQSSEEQVMVALRCAEKLAELQYGR